MSVSISNFQIEEASKNIWDEDIQNKFVDVFPSNHMNKFIDHNNDFWKKKRRNGYPFIIANTDASSKSGTY